jgi:hypothetical protein
LLPLYKWVVDFEDMKFYDYVGKDEPAPFFTAKVLQM